MWATSLNSHGARPREDLAQVWRSQQEERPHTARAFSRSSASGSPGRDRPRLVGSHRAQRQATVAHSARPNTCKVGERCGLRCRVAFVAACLLAGRRMFYLGARQAWPLVSDWWVVQQMQVVNIVGSWPAYHQVRPDSDSRRRLPLVRILVELGASKAESCPRACRRSSVRVCQPLCQRAPGAGGSGRMGKATHLRDAR